MLFFCNQDLVIEQLLTHRKAYRMLKDKHEVEKVSAVGLADMSLTKKDIDQT